MLSLVLLAASVLVAQAEKAPPETGPADLAAQVRALVRDLNAEQLTRRDQAEQALLKLGPPVLKLLPPVNDQMPAEVTQRLTRVRQFLEQLQAETTARAALVTLKGKLSVADALKKLSELSHNEIVDEREQAEGADEVTLEVDFKETPFWRALDQMLDQANLSLADEGSQHGLAVCARPSEQRARCEGAIYSGAFRLEPTRLEAVRDLRVVQNRSLKLFLAVAWEPRLHPILIRQVLSDVEAIADGKPLKIDGHGEVPAPVSDGPPSIELEIPLELPPRGVEKIDLLKGTLRALVPGDPETFRFKDVPVAKEGPAKKVEKRIGAVTVALDGLRKNNEIWELRVRVRFDDPDATLDSYLGVWMQKNEAFFTGPGDQRIAPGTWEETQQSPNEIGVRYLFELPKGPQGLTFVYKTSTAVVDLAIDYEFQNIPLP